MPSPAHPYFKKLDLIKHPRATGTGPWKVADLCKAYQWPSGLAGGGVIAIVELGGGWTATDMQAFAKANGLTVPQITDVSVDGTKNTPGGDADGEVALDIQLAWAAYVAATGKDPEIRVYWASDIAPAVRAATKDGCDVISISWGADEANWGAAAAQDMDLAAIEATQAGAIVFAASGDNDSSDGGPSSANVDVPASCPHVIGCGGTTKTASSEVVWNDSPGNADGDGTGGGYSTLFSMPTWQTGKAPSGPGRMVPDVAANADPQTGYEIYYQGAPQVVGGTSAVAPLYAGLFAAFGKKLGNNIGQVLWSSAGCFADVTQGDNGMFKAAVGPDPCTGLGAPIAGKLDGLFAAAAPAPAPTPAPTPTPTPAPPAPTLAEAIAWAESQLPGVFMTSGMAKKYIAQGLTKNWPK